MALRSFVDAVGTEWQVYDVVPRPEERRHYDRRTEADKGTPERRSEDRRVTVGRLSALSDLGLGWLCFDAGERRRRLAPIPEAWAQATEEELQRYLGLARPVRRVATPQR